MVQLRNREATTETTSEPNVLRGRRAAAAALLASGVILGGVGAYYYGKYRPQPDVAFAIGCDADGYRALHVGGNNPVQNGLQAAYDGVGRSVDAVATNLGHPINFVGHDRSKTTIAAHLERDLGYDISGKRLGLSNQAELTNGDHCFTVPGPIPPGMVEVTGKQSVADLSTQLLVTPEKLLSLNPGLQNDVNSQPTEGMVVRWTSRPINPSLSLQTLDRSLAQTVEDRGILDSTMLAVKVAKSNGRGVLFGQEYGAGDNAFLPSRQTPFMNNRDITTDGIVNTYASNYQQLPESQTIAPISR